MTNKLKEKIQAFKNKVPQLKAFLKEFPTLDDNIRNLFLYPNNKIIYVNDEKEKDGQELTLLRMLTYLSISTESSKMDNLYQNLIMDNNAKIIEPNDLLATDSNNEDALRKLINELKDQFSDVNPLYLGIMDSNYLKSIFKSDHDPLFIRDIQNTGEYSLGSYIFDKIKFDLDVRVDVQLSKIDNLEMYSLSNSVHETNFDGNLNRVKALEVEISCNTKWMENIGKMHRKLSMETYVKLPEIPDNGLFVMGRDSDPSLSVLLDLSRLNIPANMISRKQLGFLFTNGKLFIFDLGRNRIKQDSKVAY